MTKFDGLFPKNIKEMTEQEYLEYLEEHKDKLGVRKR